MPFSITVLTVLLTTSIAQYFQYISWHNQTRLQQTSERVVLAKKAYQQASDAMSKRYYLSQLYLKAAMTLNKPNEIDDSLHGMNLKFNQKIFNDYNQELRSWTISYDQVERYRFLHGPSNIMDSERVTKRDFVQKQLTCTSDSMLLSEMRRLKFNFNSLKVQFSIINYCFHEAMLPFDIEVNRAIANNGYVIPETELKAAAQRVEDVRSMSNEFRCFAQHRIASFERDQRRAVFKLSRWISDKIQASSADSYKAIRNLLERAVDECDFTRKPTRKSRFS